MSLRTLPFLGASLGLILALTACEPAGQDSGSEMAEEGQVAAESGTLRVTARDFEFEAPDEIPSGWTRVILENVGEQEHFVTLRRLPEDVVYNDYVTGVGQTFDRVWNRYDSGELNRQEALEALGAELPPWFFGADLVRAGGVALTEPGETARATVRLDPGSYVLECYVKTPQGTWHSSRGMVKELTVTSDTSDLQPPSGVDYEMTLSSFQIETSGELAAGERTVAVHVTDVPEGLVRHDINLFRLNDTTSVDQIVAWMDWMDLEQFRAPAPGYSLGGVEHLTAGRTGYMTVTLTPGRYAWVSEGYGGQGMVQEFTIE